MKEELTSEEEEIMLEEGRERDWERKDVGSLSPTAHIQEKRVCEFCDKEFDEEDMDIVRVDEGESVWLCRNCEEVLKNGEEC